ncbi:MAG: PAS domain-containing protein, partial [Candidatus Omnitrophica bacterium]|nr:PAS domain-containing protein [Candidatus Omnitrophota bacterium]
TNYVKAQRALQEIKTRFLIAAQSSNALIYEWDIASNKFHWIGDIDGALSYDEGEIERSFDAKTDLLHPDDKHRYMIAIDNLESTGEEFSIEYRIEDKNGDYRYWVEKAKGILNMNRESIRLVGVCRDITEQKNKEKSLLAQIANLEKYNESMSDRGYRIVELEHNIESLEKDFEKLKKRKIKEQD